MEKGKMKFQYLLLCGVGSVDCEVCFNFLFDDGSGDGVG
jgi:hypothetical protein